MNETRDGSGSDILFLKHACSTLRQSSNNVCGFSMMEQVRLCAVWPSENWLGSPMNHILGWMTVWEWCKHAWQKGCLFWLGRWEWDARRASQSVCQSVDLPSSRSHALNSAPDVLPSSMGHVSHSLWAELEICRVGLVKIRPTLTSGWIDLISRIAPEQSESRE